MVLAFAWWISGWMDSIEWGWCRMSAFLDTDVLLFFIEFLPYSLSLQLPSADTWTCLRNWMSYLPLAANLLLSFLPLSNSAPNSLTLHISPSTRTTTLSILSNKT